MKLWQPSGRPARGSRRVGLLVAALLVYSSAGCSGHGQGGRAAAGPTRHRVTLHAVRFDPDSLVIAAGDTVEWDNRDLVPHTVTADAGDWDSDAILADSSWSTIVSAAGIHPYHCRFHPTMHGQLIVRAR